jgi:hypothetical protein
MKKVLTSIDDCRACIHSTHFTTNSIDYSILVCDKTRTILLVTDRGKVDQIAVAIPAYCPLPDLIEDK